MKLFACQACGQLLYFESSSCVNCARQTGYLADLDDLSAVEPMGPNWRALADPERPYRFCVNWERRACNWLVDARAHDPFCLACRHNRIIPDISDPRLHSAWCRLEAAKRRLIYALLKLRLPLPAPGSGHPVPLIFDLLDDVAGQKVVTGHANGLITIAAREADDVQREQSRTSMNEPYRTLLGHFRHEIGHYYWDLLVQNTNELGEFRRVFGDERTDYEAARQHHYAHGPPDRWGEAYVSGYASMHPWEDFAETWAHYLHIVDTLEMASAFGIRLQPRISAARSFATHVDIDPYACADTTALLSIWLPTTFAVNSLNRAMGQPDLYPFVIAPAVVAKLDFVRALIQGVDRNAQTMSRAREVRVADKLQGDCALN